MVTSQRRILGGILVMVAAVASGPTAWAQGISPTNQVVITGYGTVGWAGKVAGDNANAFTASVSPVFLWQFQSRVLFEAELEFAVADGVTETGLEYAQLDFMLNDNIVLVGGKFLLPYGVFGPELHPTWINKFPTPPPIYGHHVSNFGAEALMPVLSDVGVMGRATVNPGRYQIALNAYAVNGPATDDAGALLPEIEFPASSGDNNTDKALGTRLDLALPPIARINVSYFNGDYDDQSVLDFSSWNVAGEVRLGRGEIRGEYIQTRQESETLTGIQVLKRHGFYAQGTYRYRRWEPGIRWTQIFKSDFDGSTFDTGASQVAFGMNYWFGPSVAVMGAYELNREQSGMEIENDRIVVHVAFGF